MAGKTILGLKSEHFPVVNFDSDEEDRFDFEEKTDDQELTFSVQPHTLPCLDLNHHHFSSPQNSPRVSSFDDASPLISAFLSTLSDFKLPPPFSGQLYFIPEHIVSDLYSEKLDEFAKNDQTDFPLDLNNLHINILAQVSLVKYYKNQEEDLLHYLTDDTANVLDSRIKSLIHFCLSKTEDRQISTYHKINSISEFIKTSTLAPISILFEDFNLQILVHSLCSDLISLFPHHPLLPSLIDKFTIIDPKATDLIATIPDEVDDDDDSSDDFYDQLKNIQTKPQPIKIEALNLFTHSITNVLENTQSTLSNYLTITVTEPPSMVTFEQHISDGSNVTQLTPNQFKDWVTSLPTTKKETDLNFRSLKKSKSTFPQPEDKFYSLPTGLHDDNEVKEATAETILKLLSYKGPMTDLIPDLPTVFNPNLFPIYFPLLQLIQADSAVLLRRDLVSPNLLSIEFEAHKMLTSENYGDLQKCIDDLMALLNIQAPLRRKSEVSEADFDGDEISQPVNIARLEQNRKPPTHDTPFPDSTISLLALCDIEFINNGRSPLTLSHSSGHAQIRIPLKQRQRAELLYDLYTRDVYPPYFSFRAAVAMAVNLAESDISLAVDFLF